MSAFIEADLATRRGSFALNARFSSPGGASVVFGPSGSGKTTLLRAIAGLEPGTSGTLRVGGEVWLGGSGGPVPAHQRAVGFVFQDAHLLPHLTVEGNLAYAEKRARDEGPGWDEVVGWLSLTPLLARDVGGLSGGERQRVALGRALLRRPRVLLLDEPLSALDEPARREMLPLLARLSGHFGVPMLFVTHLLDDAVRLADHMVWVEQGRVRDSGPLAAVTAQPDFVHWRGDDAGVVIEARVTEHIPADHLSELAGPWGPLWVRLQDRPVGAMVRLRVLARDVSLALTREADSTLLNQFAMQVAGLEPDAPGEVSVRLSGAASEPDAPDLWARITERSARHLGLSPGAEVFARVKAVAVVA